MGTLEVKAFLAAMLLAFGIAVPMPDFLAGMVLCMGGAYVAMIWSPPHKRGTLAATLITALVIGFVGANAHGSIAWLKGWSFHLVMFAAGALSRPIVLAASAFGLGLVQRAGDAANGLKLPGEE